MAKERPIIFSTPMVQAILQGRKTQTRRVVKRPEVSMQKCPYGQPGDVLWVRESFYPATNTPFIYKADGWVGDNTWKPSIHMPKDAARIWLKLTDVKVERLQDIAEADAIAEGIEIIDQEGQKVYRRYDGYYTVTPSAYVSYWSLWASINGEESWLANPWVWVLSFEVLSTTGRKEAANG